MGTTFVWDDLKAQANEQNHGVSLEEAVTVFDDPLLTLQDASRNDEARDAVIGFSSNGKLLTVVHIEQEGEFIRLGYPLGYSRSPLTTGSRLRAR
jgi:uncharacterized protein